MKIAICDDELYDRSTIRRFMDNFKDSHQSFSIREFSSGEELIETYQTGEKFDVLFLDMEMESLSGVETAELVRKSDNNVLLVFITSHTQYVSEAFTLNAFQFLIKPLQEDKFHRELKRILENYQKKNYRYKIKVKESIFYREVKDIYYIESFDKRLNVVTQEETYEFIGTLKEEEEKLRSYGFTRCHQSFLVNMYLVQAQRKNSFVLKNGQEIPISRQLRNQVLCNFNQFIAGGGQ